MKRLLKWIKNLFKKDKKENCSTYITDTVELTANGFTYASDIDCIHGKAYQNMLTQIKEKQVSK